MCYILPPARMLWDDTTAASGGGKMDGSPHIARAVYRVVIYSVQVYKSTWMDPLLMSGGMIKIPSLIPVIGTVWSNHKQCRWWFLQIRTRKSYFISSEHESNGGQRLLARALQQPHLFPLLRFIGKSQNIYTRLWRLRGFEGLCHSNEWIYTQRFVVCNVQSSSLESIPYSVYMGNVVWW